MFAYTPTSALPISIVEMSLGEEILLWSVLGLIYLFFIIMIPLLVYKRLETLKLRWVWIFFLIGLVLIILEWQYSIFISQYIIYALIISPACVGLMPDRFRYSKKVSQ